MRARNTLPGYSVTLILLLLMTAAATRAQTTQARISVVSLSPPRVRIEGTRDAPTKVWSFRNAYAGIIGLGERIENLSLADERGAVVAARKLAPGEYESATDAVKFSYDVKLDPPTSATDAAHVSWLAETRGALMPGDLLPLPLTHARVGFKLPDGWKIASPVKSDAAGVFDFADAESSLVFAGQDVRERVANVRGMELRVAVAGDWAFTDQEVAETVTAIVKEHAKTFGAMPSKTALVVVAPFPRQASASQWAAETRGAIVLYLAGRAPSKLSALARLSSPLAHESFHLWVPNGLSLTGDYAWFYEGFTNYQALRVSQRLGNLSFDDYLDALAHTYDGYELLKPQDTVSLLEASARRWSGADALIYSKGMLVAALYDLSVRKSTGGRRSLEDVYRVLFRRAQTQPHERDGNASVLSALDEVSGANGFTSRFIKGVEKIDLGAELTPFGLRVERVGSRNRIVVSTSLSSSQRDLLRQIGYNN
ncbi:MAG: hypothetical protein QOF61_302 [Acidobacteriota bacterium]|nr:hypothetical protein [Acidobacteriota bacterium]